MGIIAGMLALATLVSLAAVIYPFRPFRKRRYALVTAVVTFFATGLVAPHTPTETTPASAGPSSNSTASAPAPAFDCPAGSEPSGATLRVRGSGINVRTGPGTDHDRVVNAKATSVIGSTQYVTIDSSTKVLEECRQGDWSRVRVVEPDWLRDSHRGWVASRFLLGEEEFASTGFTAEDIYFDDQTRPYSEMIVRAVNKIAREDPRCKDHLDPGAVVMSTERGTPDKPVFFVTCGEGAGVVNVYFSEDDLADGKQFEAPKHIDRGQAVLLCREYAKSVANFPSTVDFSIFLDLAVTDHPNGNTTVWSSFTAQNAFGVEQEYGIRCLLDANGFIEANVVEKR